MAGTIDELQRVPAAVARRALDEAELDCPAPSLPPIAAPAPGPSGSVAKPAGWSQFQSPVQAPGFAGLAAPTGGVATRGASNPATRRAAERAALVRTRRELEAEIEALEQVACATRGDASVCHQAQAAFWDHMQADLQLRRAQLAGVNADLNALGEP